MSKDTYFDVVIAGGGTVGLTLALALSKQTRLSIAVIESKSYQQEEVHPGFDARSVALAAHSCQLYQQWGVSGLTELGHEIRHIHVSDKGHLGQCRLHAEDYGLESLGVVIELFSLGNAIQKAVKGAEKISWFCPNTVADVKQSASEVTLVLDNGEQLSAGLLIVAEGANSPTREKLNIGKHVTPYDQSAVIANVRCSKAHNGWAFERFTEHGPLAMLPLPDTESMTQSGRCSLVWTVPQESVSEYLAMTDAEFIEKLQASFGYRLGLIQTIGERSAYPLALHRSETHTSHRVAVLGNASQTLHPIAGQGLNLGMRDIESMVNLLVEADSEQQDVGEHSLLQRFSAHRRKDQSRVIDMTDGLVRLFSNQYTPMVVGRNIGLIAMQLMPELKRGLATRAMGME